MGVRVPELLPDRVRLCFWLVVGLQVWVAVGPDGVTDRVGDRLGDPGLRLPVAVAVELTDSVEMECVALP